MVYRLTFKTSDGTRQVQYGANAIYKLPRFMNEELTNKFTSITVHSSIDTIFMSADRYNKFAKMDIDYEIQFAETKTGPWHDMTTQEAVENQLEDLMAV